MAHEELFVPVFASLEPVYGEGPLLEEARRRFDNLKSKFLQAFGHLPDVHARSPGLFLSVFFFFWEFVCRIVVWH